MARNKQFKYSQISQSDLIFEDTAGKPLRLAGKWNSVFTNSNPIVLEIGCGYGEYTIGLARQYPEYNFIGLDIKGDRLFQGLEQVKNYNLTNVRFIRSRAEEIGKHFCESELSTIWITHPDPQPKKERRRLIYKRFLAMYKQVLADNSSLYLRTDSTALFEYSLQTLANSKDFEVQFFSWDLYSSSWFRKKDNFVTRYEKQFHESKIKLLYLKLQKS
jgi:tRNA (guanine-N7-)-methyltransferase